MERLNTNNQTLPNFRHMDSVDGKIYGAHNTVTSVNPHKSRFVATYPNGKEVYGTGLFKTGWDNIPQGLSKLRYEISTGHVIEIPKFKGYFPTIEVSCGMDGSRVFHFINVNCLADKEVIVYKIVLRQDKISPQKIGDVIISKQPLPEKMASAWKYTT